MSHAFWNKKDSFWLTFFACFAGLFTIFLNKLRMIIEI